MCDVVLTCYCSGYEIKKDVMIGESVTYGEQEKSCSVSVGTRGEKADWKTKTWAYMGTYYINGY